MYLSDKRDGNPRKLDDHEELEVLLESFSKQVEEIVNEAENIQVSLIMSLRSGCMLCVAVFRFLRTFVPFAVLVDRSFARLSPYLLLTPLSAVERAIYPGDRRAHPRLEPECSISARPEGVHLDNGDRHRNARLQRIRY